MAGEIAPLMSNNVALRMQLAVFMDENGNLKPGAPGGPMRGKNIRIYRHAATGPNPTLAYMIAPASDKRVSGMLVNLNDSLTIYYGSDPTVTDATGGTLVAGASLPITTRGPIYVYTLSGAPNVEFVETYDD